MNENHNRPRKYRKMNRNNENIEKLKEYLVEIDGEKQTFHKEYLENIKMLINEKERTLKAIENDFKLRMETLKKQQK